MYVKRALAALAIAGAAFCGVSSANAASFWVPGTTASITFLGNTFGPCSLPGSCTGAGVGNGANVTDTWYVSVDALANTPADAGFVAITNTAGNMTNVSWEWRSDNPPNTGNGANLIDSGTISNPGVQNSFQVDLSATVPPGGVFKWYELLIKYSTTGAAGASYNLTLSTTPCTPGGACAPSNVPLPPAAILFLTGLAGLGLLGRQRRKATQA